jgi:hypothetical protein
MPEKHDCALCWHAAGLDQPTRLGMERDGWGSERVMMSGQPGCGGECAARSSAWAVLGL